MDTAKPILDVRTDVTFSYPEVPGQTMRVRYVIPATFAARANEVNCIEGVSGFGKSTLLTLLAGLRRPRSGRIRYGFPGTPIEVDAANWEDVVGPSVWKRIGYAFQRPEIIAALDVTENLSVAAPAGTDLYDARCGAHVLFSPKEWETVSRARVTRLSGGQIQRLGLLRAFIGRRPLVIVDEPTNNLDPAHRERVADLVSVAVREEGVAVILVTHEEPFLDYLVASGVAVRVWRIAESRGDAAGEVVRSLVGPMTVAEVREARAGGRAERDGGHDERDGGHAGDGDAGAQEPSPRAGDRTSRLAARDA